MALATARAAVFDMALQRMQAGESLDWICYVCRHHRSFALPNMVWDRLPERITAVARCLILGWVFHACAFLGFTIQG